MNHKGKLLLLLESPKDRPGIPDEEPEELWCVKNMILRTLSNSVILNELE